MTPDAGSNTADSDDIAGLFGPDSITWRLHADPLLIVGGLRALLLQALHPLALAGVAEHSASGRTRGVGWAGRRSSSAC